MPDSNTQAQREAERERERGKRAGLRGKWRDSKLERERELGGLERGNEMG